MTTHQKSAARWSAMVLPILACIVSGCIQVEQTLILREDASGSLAVKLVVPDETSDQIKAMNALAGEMARAAGEAVKPEGEDDFTQLVFSPEEKMIRDKVASYSDLGLVLEKLSVESRHGERKVALKLRFNDIVKLAQADFFSGYGFSLLRTGDGNYSLFTRPATDEPLNPDWSTSDTETQKLLAPFLRGFKFRLEVRTPGRILKTNAGQRTATTAAWTYEFDTDADAVARLQRERMQIVFDGGGLKLPDVRQPKPEEPPKKDAG